MSRSGRVLSRDELVAQVNADRAAGHTIAFANGCFDLLHAGHVRYLQAASAEADRLVVAINDDDSVAALKGPGRPIMAARDRAEVVAALRGVDYVVVFAEPTVAPLLLALEPDVHCKGTDYTVDTVPERETVRGYGGRIAIVGDPKDHSTRDLLRRIRSGGAQGSGPILIVRLGALGDVVHTIPAVAAIRTAFPQSRIDWLVDRKHRDIVDLVTVVDRVIAIDSNSLAGWSEAVRLLRQTKYATAIDLQGLLKSAMLARSVHGRRTIGFPMKHLREKAARLFYTAAPDPGDATHVIYKNLALLTPLAVIDRRLRFPLEIPHTPTVVQVVTRFEPNGYVLINPGAAWPNKQWPPERFGEVAAAMARDFGWRSLVLWGPGEQEIAHAVVAASAGAAESSPPTTIPDLVGIARHARMMISGDTGPLHIAGAVNTPIVALYGPTQPERNGPWGLHDVAISRVQQCSCLYERKCRKTERCIDDISVAEVMSAVHRRVAARG
jgi:lipopolysaccharide heptosyltransferase I